MTEEEEECAKLVYFLAEKDREELYHQLALIYLHQQELDASVVLFNGKTAELFAEAFHTLNITYYNLSSYASVVYAVNNVVGEVVRDVEPDAVVLVNPKSTIHPEGMELIESLTNSGSGWGAIKGHIGGRGIGSMVRRAYSSVAKRHNPSLYISRQVYDLMTFIPHQHQKGRMQILNPVLGYADGLSDLVKRLEEIEYAGHFPGKK
jgi:hypothetical protein